MSYSREDTLPPIWARMLGVQGFQTFIALVEGYFARHDIGIQLDAEEGVLRPVPGALEQSSVFGLQNIAQTCSQADRDRWHDLIENHFDCIFGEAGDENALTIDVSDFGRVRPFIRSRLYPLDLLQQSVETVHQPGPEGTLEVIVLDLPRSVRTVARSEADAWPLERDELFKLGRSNLLAGGLMKDNVVSMQPGVDLHLYASDTFYAASHSLILDAYMPSDLVHGALVGIPKRDVLLIHHIRNIGVAEAIGAMLQAVIGMHQDGPGSLSANLYWFETHPGSPGELRCLPYALKGNSLYFTPPGEFVDMLNVLSERANLT